VPGAWAAGSAVAALALQTRRWPANAALACKRGALLSNRPRVNPYQVSGKL
jgi:hypothetical protein